MRVGRLKKSLAKRVDVTIYRNDAFLPDCAIYRGQVCLIPERILKRKVVMFYPLLSTLVIIVK